MSVKDPISLRVLTPEKVLCEVNVTKVSLPGAQGRFMILKNHAPIISSLEEGDVVYESQGKEDRIHINSGFVEVNANTIIICAEV